MHNGYVYSKGWGSSEVKCVCRCVCGRGVTMFSKELKNLMILSFIMVSENKYA